MTDTNAFMDGTAFDGDSVVGMNLEYRIWAGTNEVKFVAIVFGDKYMLSNSKFMRGAFFVDAKEAVVDLCLAMFGERENVGVEGDVKEHVAIEYEGTGREVAECGDWVATEGMHGSG